MPSGKRARQQRRASVPPPPVRGPRQRQASPRVLAIAGAVVLVVIAAIVAAILLTRGGDKGIAPSSLPTRGSLVNGLPGAADVHAEFKGIPQNGMFLGSPAAPVHLIEYIDPQCPFCQEFETQVMPDVVARYVRTGKVQVEARALAFIGPDSIRGRNGIFAASLQDHAFDFMQLLYDNQQTENTGWLNDAMVAKAAESIPGVNPRRLVRDLASDGVAGLRNRADSQATAAKVHSTPTVLVGKAGGPPKVVQMQSATDAATLNTAIEDALS